MKKAFLKIMSVLCIFSMTSCGIKHEADAPTVKTEIYGSASAEISDEKSEPIMLNYAVCGQIDPEEYRLIQQFNEADNGYVIVTRDYSEIAGADESGQIVYNEERQQALKIRIMQDITEGKIDIIRDYYLGDSQLMDILAARGTFADLYEFMADDKEINADTLNEHILKLHETDGKLYTLPFYYSFNTLIGQTRYVGDKQDWSMDGLISHWEQMPENAAISGHREKFYVYRTILSGMMSDFIDYKKAEVYFDSPEFKAALEFCNTFKNDADSEYDYNALNFIEEKYFCGFADTHIALWNEKGEPYTFVGYPSDDSSGGFIDTRGSRFAVCASSDDEKRQGAWEFIRTFCLEDYQLSHYCKKEKVNIDGEIKEVYLEPVGFPMNLNAYDKLAKEAMAGEHKDSTLTMSGIEYNVELLTQAELDRLTDYINHIQKLITGIDNDLRTIIVEEIIKYFNDEISVDECIDIIQNRAKIMVSEKQ